MDKILKNFFLKQQEKSGNSRKKIENIIFLIILLVVTVIIMNYIWNESETKTIKKYEENTETESILANEKNEDTKQELESRLEKILSYIKNVGQVKVFINYAESNCAVPIYDETTTTSNTEEGDSSGGNRNTTQTEIHKEVVYSEKSGIKEPVTQKTIMPLIQGAIVTAEGADDATTKTSIINAIQAATGLSIDKIQVFEMKK